MLAIKDGVTSSGAPHYKMLCRYSSEAALIHPDAIKIPCGHCRACRASKCRAWADRMILELDHSEKAIFLTLTYNDDNVPTRVDMKTGELVHTLCKRDFQLFMKRLRKAFPNAELRYYMCGEYGKRTNRPHGHYILYGLGLDDLVFDRDYEFTDGNGETQVFTYNARLFPRGRNELGYVYYSSNFLEEKVWQNGFCWITDVSYKACAYVARYVKKKDYGNVKDFDNPLREPEFSLMSRRPGIGMYYPIQHPECTDFSKIYFSDGVSLQDVPLPAAFLEKLKETNPLRYVEIKDQRYRASLDAEFTRLRQTDLSSMELDGIAEDHLAQTEPVIDFYRNL